MAGKVKRKFCDKRKKAENMRKEMVVEMTMDVITKKKNK